MRRSNPIAFAVWLSSFEGPLGVRWLCHVPRLYNVALVALTYSLKSTVEPLYTEYKLVPRAATIFGAESTSTT